MRAYDVIVAGGGPGGLVAAQSAARHGASVLLVEQSGEFGSPTRTSGGSFIKDLEQLDIPRQLYHPILRCRMISPGNSVAFEYDTPMLCVMDVRGVFQLLAARAASAGVLLQLATSAVEPVREGNAVRGVVTRSRLYGDEAIASRVLIDATGYRSALLKKAGIHPGFARFGVGSEFDFCAPAYDESEVVLAVGSQVAPAGYAWAFPWGNKRVRVGAGIIHGDSREHPDLYLRKFCANASRFGINLSGAQPIEYHYGLIPSERLTGDFAGDGILGVGDAAGQASTLVGEGIRWAIRAGHMAGAVAARAVADGDCSAQSLGTYQREWEAAFGTDLRIASRINRRIARWDDATWDRSLELLKLFTPQQFGEALRTNFSPGWIFRLIRSHPSLLKEGVSAILGRLKSRGSGTFAESS
jgi:digeranylgeranylglycerophospholipid reductase